MKKLAAIILATGLLIGMNSCEKDEDTTPDTPPVTNPTDTTGNGGGSGGGSTGDSTVVVANVNGLKQNYIKADGRGEDRLYITDIGGYTSGNQDYFTLHMTGESNYLIDFTIKGSELKEGNYSLKKFRLGSSPADGEAVMYVSIDGNLMDFESTDNKSVSIKKDENGFFVIKMAPIVGTNRNSWDEVITAPISVHVVSNHTKISMSNTDGDTFENKKYDYRTKLHAMSNQPSATMGVFPVSLTFRDYDFSTVSSLPKTTYTLATSGANALDLRNGTAPKAVNMSYLVSWVGWSQNYNKTQTIEMELTPKTMIVTFTDIEFVHPSDPTRTKTVSGQWEMAR